MSLVYCPQDAFVYAKRFISDQDLDRLSPRILDDVHRMIWMYAPWRWTLGAFPSVTLLANTQDYTVSVPADFLFLQYADIADGKNRRHLHCGAYMPSAVGYISGQPSQVSVQGSTMRVLPCPGTFATGAPSQQIISVYKKLAPQVTRANMTTAGSLVMPDEYFWVYQEGVLWRAMSWAQDPRCGDVKMQGDQAAYAGQRAVFEAGLKMIADLEKLNRVDSQEEQR